MTDRKCSCGSGKPNSWQHDARGIPLCRTCEDCHQAKMQTYRPDIVTNPNYTAGARFKVNQWVTAGLQAEDIAETTNLNGVVNVSFEDKDIAYLLGFVSFAR